MKEFPIVDIKKAAEEGEGVLAEVEALLDDMRSIVSAAGQVLAAIGARLGDEAAQKLVQEISPTSLSKELMQNSASFNHVSLYMKYIAMLLDHPDIERNLEQPAYLSTLSELAKLERLLDAGTFFYIACSSDIGDRSLLARCTVELQAFTTCVGRRVFVAHMNAYSANIVDRIMTALPSCQLAALHVKAVHAKDLCSILPSLLLGFDIGAFASNHGRLDIDSPSDGGEQHSLLSKASHNINMANFRNFVATAEIKSVWMPVAVASQERVLIPTPEALTILQVTAEACDLILYAASMHHEIVPKMASALQPSSKTDLFEYGVKVLAAFQTALDFFEARLMSDEALAIETAGWNLPRPPAMMRSWRDSLAVFAGRLQAGFLQAWMELLTELIGTVKASTPSWQVAFCSERGDALDLDMAGKVLGGKLGPLIRAHNALHELLQASGALGLGAGPMFRHESCQANIVKRPEVPQPRSSPSGVSESGAKERALTRIPKHISVCPEPPRI